MKLYGAGQSPAGFLSAQADSGVPWQRARCTPPTRDIAGSGSRYRTVIWCPSGSRGWGASPFNQNCWRTIDGGPIITPDVAVSNIVARLAGAPEGNWCIWSAASAYWIWNHPRQSPTIFPCSSYFPVFSSPTTTLEVIGNTEKTSSEKAGVGGSTPSLATIIFNGLAAQPEISHL
jgi:hypothetical protein